MTEQLNQSNMDLIVERVFTKAQNEHDYCTFYGDLCEKMIRLELQLRGVEPKLVNLKYSNFRKTFLSYCKSSFDQFFQQEQAAMQKGKMDED